MSDLAPNRLEESYIISREDALLLTCSVFHHGAVRRAGTLETSITVQPGRTVDDNWVGAVLIPVPGDSEESIGSLFSDAYSHCKVTINFLPAFLKDGSTPPTLLDFVTRTVDIWERWAEYLSHPRVELKRQEYEKAIELLKDTFSFKEMTGFDIEDYYAQPDEREETN